MFISSTEVELNDFIHEIETIKDLWILTKFSGSNFSSKFEILFFVIIIFPSVWILTYSFILSRYKISVRDPDVGLFLEIDEIENGETGFESDEPIVGIKETMVKYPGEEAKSIYLTKGQAKRMAKFILKYFNK